MEKILVIGNGFDLASGFPTKYIDFLDFLDCINDVRKIIDGKEDSWVPSSKGDYKNRYVYCNQGTIATMYRNLEADLQKEFKNLSNENIWYRYFKEVSDTLDDGWIDFESEIVKSLQSLDMFFTRYIESGQSDAFSAHKNSENENRYNNLKMLLNEKGINISTEKINEKLIHKINVLLEKSLKNLIRCLEIYLVMVCDSNHIKKIKEFELIEFDKILSFNYTDTYSKNYYDKCKVCYVHGEAKLKNEINSNNMVLGCSEYLPDTNCTNFRFETFEKNFQRTMNNTSALFEDWIIEINKRAKTKYVNDGDYIAEIHIFGHSLDFNDRDILTKLLKLDRTKIYVYHLNIEQKKSEIKNLAKLLGSEYFYANVNSTGAKFEFKEQETVQNL